MPALLPPLLVVGVLVGAEVVLDPLVVEADAAVVGAGAVAAHLRVRRGAALVGDALAEAAVEQQESVGGRLVLLPGGLHALAGGVVEDAVVVVGVLALRLDVDDEALLGDLLVLLDDGHVHAFVAQA